MLIIWDFERGAHCLLSIPKFAWSGKKQNKKETLVTIADNATYFEARSFQNSNLD
jgi:hypothetical protein